MLLVVGAFQASAFESAYPVTHTFTMIQDLRTGLLLDAVNLGDELHHKATFSPRNHAGVCPKSKEKP